MAAKQPLGKRIAKNLRKKWIQVIISTLLLVIAVIVSHKLLVKQLAKTDAEKQKEASEYKFLICDKCFKELPYNKELEGKRAVGCKCKPNSGGVWLPSKESMANSKDPLANFYTATLVASLLWLISLYFLLARKDAQPPYFFYKCIHCRDMLRYTANGFDAMVVCPSCGLFIRLPSEEEALTMDDHNDDHADLVMEHFATKLKETGYQFPEERAAAEEAAKAAEGQAAHTDPTAHGPGTPQ